MEKRLEKQRAVILGSRQELTGMKLAIHVPFMVHTVYVSIIYMICVLYAACSSSTSILIHVHIYRYRNHLDPVHLQPIFSLRLAELRIRRQSRAMSIIMGTASLPNL